MSQLCLWTKIRIKQRLVLGASTFQCMSAGFCAPNATILLVYISAKINMSFIWKDDFFAKIDIFCKSITGPLPSFVQAYTQTYSFVQYIELIVDTLSFLRGLSLFPKSLHINSSARYISRTEMIRLLCDIPCNTIWMCSIIIGSLKFCINSVTTTKIEKYVINKIK